MKKQIKLTKEEKLQLEQALMMYFSKINKTKNPILTLSQQVALCMSFLEANLENVSKKLNTPPHEKHK